MGKVNELQAKFKYQSDPKLQAKFGSFEKYLEFQQLQLKRESAWTYGKNLSDNIKQDVKNWVKEKEIARDNASERYELAMQMYAQQNTNYENALKELQRKYASFGDDKSKYGSELKSFLNSRTALSSADTEVECARDHLNSANSFYGKISFMG